MNQRQKLEKILDGRIKAKERLQINIKEIEELKIEDAKKCDELKLEHTRKCNELLSRINEELIANDVLIKKIRNDLGINEDIKP